MTDYYISYILSISKEHEYPFLCSSPSMTSKWRQHQLVIDENEKLDCGPNNCWQKGSNFSISLGRNFTIYDQQVNTVPNINFETHVIFPSLSVLSMIVMYTSLRLATQSTRLSLKDYKILSLRPPNYDHVDSVTIKNFMKKKRKQKKLFDALWIRKGGIERQSKSP